MITIKTVGVVIGAATLLAALGASAQTLNITAPGYPPDQAGPYTVNIIGPSTIGTIYTGADAPAATYPGATEAFQTFCIASDVNYYPGSTYYYSASTSVDPFALETQGTSTYVAWGTAYLYDTYLHNPNAFADGGTEGTGNNVANDALQEAIWILQGQSLSGITLAAGDNSTTLANDLYDDLLAATNAATVASTIQKPITVTANVPKAFNVEALNMSTVQNPNGIANDYVQPQLVELGNGSQGGSLPEPSTVFAGALLLLPLGVSAARILRKNKNREV